MPITLNGVTGKRKYEQMNYPKTQDVEMQDYITSQPVDIQVLYFEEYVKHINTLPELHNAISNYSVVHSSFNQAAHAANKQRLLILQNIQQAVQDALPSSIDANWYGGIPNVIAGGINAVNGNGDTLLNFFLWIAKLSSLKEPTILEVVQLLLNNGAYVKQPNKQGISPLMRAALMGHINVAYVLLNHGADLYQEDNEGANALIYATRSTSNRKLTMIKFLLEQYPNAYKLNQDINAALHEMDTGEQTFEDREVINLLRKYNTLQNWPTTSWY